MLAGWVSIVVILLFALYVKTEMLKVKTRRSSANNKVKCVLYPYCKCHMDIGSHETWNIKGE